jgi:hypothetical protein
MLFNKSVLGDAAAGDDDDDAHNDGNPDDHNDGAAAVTWRQNRVQSSSRQIEGTLLDASGVTATQH